VSMDIPRREFLSVVPLTLAAACIARADQAGAQPPRASGPHPLYPQHDPNLVRDLVGAAHRDEAKVREIVAAYPSMVNAAWDWGFGDWETPLGAAAHTGRRAIAEFLLEQGARMDIFAAAMLGHVEVVRGFLTASPALARTRGPHGITLLSHARAGGDDAAAAVEFLATIPEADIPEPDLPLSEEERSPLLGSYRYGTGESEVFEVKFARQLQIQRAGQSARNLRRTAADSFAPAGSPRVAVRFEGPRLTIVDGPLRIEATRG
jgi:hypothetical protein